jgi:hypothetical protein
MRDADRALTALAGRQHQVFTRRQALACGLSPSALQRRVTGGALVVCGPHTLHVAGATLDYRGRLQAGLLDLGPEALVSGPAAAALHELDGFDDGPLHFLVPRAQRARTTVGVVSSSPDIAPLDGVTVDGLRVTSGTRTVLELIGRVSERELGNAIDSCLRRGLSAPAYLRHRLHELGRRGRPGVAAFERTMESGHVQGWLEREFLRLVRSAALPPPLTQRVYRRDNVHIARVDFDFDPLPIVVEVGGRRGYLSAADRRRQEHRRNELQLLGKVMYFFTSEDVADAASYVISTLRNALERAA